MMLPPPLLAFWPWTAATTALLAAAAAPILIHLWTRQQFQRTQWAAMEYLLAALQKNASRMQFEQWLLLALRVAILLMAALAVADPTFSCRLSPGLETAIGLETRTHTVLILDGSYSMDSRSGDATRFDRAKQLASKLLDQHSPGDAYTLLLMTEPPRTVIGEPAFNAQDVADEVAALKLPHTGGNLPATLAAAAQVIDRARQRTQPRLDRHRVVVLTDLGKSTWREAESAEVRRIVGDFAKGEVPLEVVDVGGDAGDNLAIVRLEERNPLVTPGRDTIFEAQIQSFAKRDVDRATLQFFIDGRQVHSETVRVPAGERVTSVFPYRFETTGDHVVEARLGPDALSVDNHRWRCVPVRDSLRVLCVGPRPAETFFVSRVLAPREEEKPRVKVEEIREGDLLAHDLKPYDAVILCNVGRFGATPADEAATHAVLASYLQRGGGLIFFLGDEVRPEIYARSLGATREMPMLPRILPAKLGPIGSGESDADIVKIDPLDFAHPIVSTFRGHSNGAGLLTTPVLRYIKLEPAAEAKVAVGLSTGDPLIVAERWPKGGVVLVATDASTSSVDRTTNPPTPWTLLPTWGSFGPLVHEMVNWTVRPRYLDRNLQVGQEIRGASQANAAESLLEIARPDGSAERVRMLLEGDEATWGFASTEFSGPYEAKLPAQGTQRFAVNVDTTESDPARVEIDALPDELRTQATPAASSGSIGPDLARSDLYRILLGMTLALIVTESFLAWYFGSRRR